MAYSTSSDIELAISEPIFLQLADDDDDEAVDSDVVDLAIAAADAKIDAALGTRFTVPLTTVPDVVKFASMWLAICQLGARRGVLPEEYASQCTYWERWLKDVKEGNIDVPGLEENDTSLPTSTTEEQARQFVRDRKDLDGESLNPDETPTIDVW